MFLSIKMQGSKHDNDNEEKESIDGPLHFQPEMVVKWKKLDEDERNEALHASFIWLMSDFLFSSNNLPNSWLEYLESEDMLGIKKGTINLEFPVLQNNVLTNPQLTVIKMLFKAHQVLREAISNRKDILNLIEFIKKIEFPLTSVDRAIYYAKNQEQMEKMCSALLDLAKTFPADAKPEPGFEFNLHQFAKSYTRRLVVAVLVGRSIGIIVCKVCQSGNLKLVREIMSVCSELEQSVWHRQNGNEHFRQHEYDKAIDAYTKSLEMTKYSAIAYCNRCQAALNVKNYKLAICDGYRVIALKPYWGKAYYRLAEAYKEGGSLVDALFFNKLGLEMSDDDNETDELKKQRAKFTDVLKSLKDSSSENLNPSTSKKKKVKKSKKKNNKDSNESNSFPEPPDDLPPLLSDNDSMRDVSDNELDVSAHFKVIQREVERRAKLKEEEDRKKELEEREIQSFLNELQARNMERLVKDLFCDNEIMRRFMDNNPLFPSAERIEQSFARNKKANSESKNGKGMVKKKKAPMAKEAMKETLKSKEKIAGKSDGNSKTNTSKAMNDEDSEHVSQPSNEQKLKKLQVTKETPKEAQKSNESDSVKNDSNSKTNISKNLNDEDRKDLYQFVKENKHKKTSIPKEAPKEPSKPKEIDHFKLYNNSRTSGSKALTDKDFDFAISQYDIAIQALEKIKVSRVSNADRFVLFYSRGFVSLEVRTPSEIARSLDYFAMLIKPSKECGNYKHPVLYYAIAYAHYLLNNFFMITNPLTTGIAMIEEKQVKPLTWPGVDVILPESEPGYLKKLMQDLLRAPQHPPRADAICNYEQCEKEAKSSPQFYSICDKEVDRKEIYHSDYNFEGYIKLFCSWNCISNFHLKCWSKFKHDNFKKSGDKDVLDIPCFTDGCKGFLSRIVMIDESQKVKKDIISEKAHSSNKEENKKPSAPKMKKNERNFSKRVKQMEEAKQKKQEMRRRTESGGDANPTKPKIQLEKIYTDDDIASATVLKREIREGLHSSKAKPYKQRSNKQANTITLNTFLEQSREQRLDTVEIEQEILASRSGDAPFHIPDELIDEVQHFESTLSDDEVLWTSCLYEYFENFFETNGPVKVQDDLLLQQQLLFPDSMRAIIEMHGDIISFLLKNQYRFLIVAPYIGIPSQEQQLKELSEEFQMSLIPKKPTHRQLASTLDTLDCDFDGPSTLSDFARDLYDVGEVSLSEVQNITGLSTIGGGLGLSGGDVGRPTGGGMELDSFDDPIDFPATQNGNTNFDLPEKLCLQMDEFLNKNAYENQPTDDNKQPFAAALTPSSSEKTSIPGDDDEEEEEEEEEEENKEVACWSFSVTTQTSLAASYFDEMKDLREKNFELQSQVEELNSKCAHITLSSRNEISSKTKELEKTKDSLAIAWKNVSDMSEQFELESKRVAVERSTWQENLQMTNEKLVEARNVQMEQSEQIKKLEQKLKGKEEDCDKLSIILQTQRTAWLEEKAQMNNEKDRLIAQLQQVNQRVLEAEMKVLENDRNYAIKILLKARSECEKIVSELEKLIRNYSSNPQAQAEVLKGYRKWKTNIDVCTQYAEQAKQQFETNCELLRGGVKWSDLTHTQSPTPPPPGPSLQQVAASAMRIANMTSVGLGNNPFQIPHPSASLLNNNVTDRISSPHTMSSRLPQPPIGTGKHNFSVPNTNSHIVATSHSEPPAPVSQPKAGSFEKIMVQLQTLFPSVSRPDLALCIKEVRQNNRNSLAGLSFENIVQQASMIVHSKKLSPKLDMSISTTSSSSSSSWNINNRESNTGLSNFVEEDPCVICHDPMSSGETHKLLCNHVFHRSCLSQWLERNRTCPTCRDYAIDTTEFPTLGSSAKRT